MGMPMWHTCIMHGRLRGMEGWDNSSYGKGAAPCGAIRWVLGSFGWVHSVGFTRRGGAGLSQLSCLLSLLSISLSLSNFHAWVHVCHMCMYMRLGCLSHYRALT